ncbi:MAG: diaminopimelate decarboxylase [Chloroflexota bacterium]
MPISESFRQRLFPMLGEIAAYFGTPFHIYDEHGIRETGQALIEAFSRVDNFREYFAVKALPNPQILKIIHDMGFGFDCSSTPELSLSRQVGAQGEEIMFTSNNTSAEEFEVAFAQGGCILNLDDVSLLGKLPRVPDLLCFRYNPGTRRSGNSIIGNPVEAKFGITHEQLHEVYRRARDAGVSRFGLHTMLVSNERDYHSMLSTAQMLLEQVRQLTEDLQIHFEFVNIGGGLGIPYQAEDVPLDLKALGSEIGQLFESYKVKYRETPKLYMESGRYLTGPHGVLVTKVINRKETYRTYIGVDANMSALMRPGMYGAHHHIDVLDRNEVEEIVDVVGALCENNDKFAIQRQLPITKPDDLLIIHDTGAHGHAMGFNYNGRLRPKELLLCADGTVKLIRRAETIDDYFATLDFEPQQYAASADSE